MERKDEPHIAYLKLRKIHAILPNDFIEKYKDENE